MAAGAKIQCWLWLRRLNYKQLLLITVASAQPDFLTVAPSNAVDIIGEAVQLNCSYNESLQERLKLYRHENSWYPFYDSDFPGELDTDRYTVDGEYSLTVNNPGVADATEYMCEIIIDNDIVYATEQAAATIVLYGKYEQIISQIIIEPFISVI